IEDEKYENFTVILSGLEQNTSKFKCILKRKNNTFAYIERTNTGFKLERINKSYTFKKTNTGCKFDFIDTLKLLKEETNNFKWINEEQHKIEQKNIEKEITRQKSLELNQQNFCETNTDYSLNIQYIYNQNPTNFNFAKIRSLTQNCGVWDELNNGVEILTTDDQLSQYIFSYGKMHQAKLLQSFEAISNLKSIINNQEIQINDYGCGQGIGSIVFIDYLKSIRATNFKISKIKLIEPSELALKRASLHVKYSLKSLNQNENVLSIPKELDAITNEDILTTSTSIKFHIFSNIIDVENISIQSIYTKISETQKGENYFICVSPKFREDGNHPRNLKLNEFMGYFQKNQNVTVIKDRESNIPNPSNPLKPYKRFERVFKTSI
ncbi:hypothetical protein, partial [Tenacibaculum piscium]|uniref:hypothetical protein n=1 Tax=Tenacibaculum piscium TaxID=1458515 RepID=UPI0018E9AAD4